MALWRSKVCSRIKKKVAAAYAPHAQWADDFHPRHYFERDRSFLNPLSLSTNPPLDIVFGFIMAPQGNATAGATLLRL